MIKILLAYCLVFGFLMLILMLPDIIRTYQNAQFAKVGLEQCKYNQDETIWVKSCKEYIELKK